MTIFSWNIRLMEVVPQEGSLNEVVIIIYWDRNASRVSGGKTYTAHRTGISNLGPPDPYNFTPFNQLTQQQVVGWVEASLGQDQIDAIDLSLEGEIDSQITPPTEVLPPPWQ